MFENEREKNGGHPMTEGFSGILLSATVAQAQIRILAAVLKMIRDLLQKVLAALPLSAQERNPQGGDLDADPDITSEIRRVLECVLMDGLEPAIRDLSAVAELGTGNPPAA
jgi:hypothetical protein